MNTISKVKVIGALIASLGLGSACENGCGDDSAGNANNNSNTNENQNQGPEEVARGEACLRQYSETQIQNADLCSDATSFVVQEFTEENAYANLPIGGLKFEAHMEGIPAADASGYQIPTSVDIYHMDGETLVDASELQMTPDTPIDAALFTPNDPLIGPREGEYAFVATDLQDAIPPYEETIPWEQDTEECGLVSGETIVRDETVCVDYLVLKLD